MTRLPRRNSDRANEGLMLRASDIERTRPEIGTAAEATAMAAVLAYNIRLLRDAGVTAFHHQFCHECGLSSFSGQDNRTHICGYCGHGPFGPGWCNSTACALSTRPVMKADQAEPPGENTWWVVEVTGIANDPILVCGKCLPQIPPFMNRYQSQLLNPDPVAWGGQRCEGCKKALVIVVLEELAESSWAGVSEV